MSRLVDVDKITDKEISQYLGVKYASCTEDIRSLIDDQPTAFDVEEVVRELRDLKMRYYFTIANTGDADMDCAYLNTANAIDRAIEIVKRGGRDEK